MKNRLTLYSYLLEIQYRFLYLFISFVTTFITAYSFSFELFFVLVQPFFAPKYFIFTDVTEALSTTLHVCLVITVHLIIPFLFYQGWSFVIPGFFQFERQKLTETFFSFFFAVMVEAFSIFYLLLPEIFAFLFSFEINEQILTIQLEARIQSYIFFTFKLYLWLLLFFQLPLVFYLLFKFKLITARFLSLYRKYYYFFSLCAAGFISPPDIIYQLTIAFFFNIVYEIAIWVGFVYEKRL